MRQDLGACLVTALCGELERKAAIFVQITDVVARHERLLRQTQPPFIVMRALCVTRLKMSSDISRHADHKIIRIFVTEFTRNAA